MFFFLPFQVYQETDISIGRCDVAGHYMHKQSELEIDVIDCCSWFRCHTVYKLLLY